LKGRGVKTRREVGRENPGCQSDLKIVRKNSLLGP